MTMSERVNALTQLAALANGDSLLVEDASDTTAAKQVLLSVVKSFILGDLDGQAGDAVINIQRSGSVYRVTQADATTFDLAIPTAPDIGALFIDSSAPPPEPTVTKAADNSLSAPSWSTTRPASPTNTVWIALVLFEPSTIVETIPADQVQTPFPIGGRALTAADILTMLLTVDSDTSGLNATTLVGLTPDEVAALGGGGGVSDGVVNAVALSLNGQDLTLTLGRTIGADLADTQTLPAGGGTYTLPQATESDLGGVEGATASEAQANSGSAILGWANTRLHQFLTHALPTASLVQAESNTGSTRLAWTVSRIHNAVIAALPTATQAEAQSNTNSASRRAWTVQRLKQLLTHNLPTMVQTDIDSATTERRAITGALIAANAAPDASHTERGIVELATGVETIAGTDIERAATPFDVNAALNDRASDATPVNTDTAGAGTAVKHSRDDHDHGITGGGDGATLNGNGPPAGNSGKNDDVYRDDETGAMYKKESDAWSAILYTPAISAIGGTTIIAGADNIPFEDVSGGDENKISVRNLGGHFGGAGLRVNNVSGALSLYIEELSARGTLAPATDHIALGTSTQDFSMTVSGFITALSDAGLLGSDSVIVSETEPPDPADVDDDDLTKMYIHVNADGVIKTISYIREVDPHIFSLTSEEYAPITQQYRGFRAAGNYGYLVPRRNIVVMEHTTDVIALFDLKFESGVTTPFDYTGYAGGLTLYRRLKTSTGDWSHHNLVRDAGDHFNFQGSTGAAFFGSNNRYDVIIRTGQHGDGTSATVPLANRLSPYPDGIKREYLPNADNIDNITQLYDIIREVTSGGTFEGLTDTPAALGTAGQIPAVNTAGDALEFVDAGGGTFVSLTDTPAALGTAGQGVIVNTAGDALEFADIGGNDATAPDLFLAAVVASTAQGLSAADYTNYLTLVDGDELVNRGGYTIVLGANARQRVIIPADGTYTIKSSMLSQITTAGGARNYVEWAIIVKRSSVITFTAPASTYSREQLSDLFYTHMSYTGDLLAGDQIEIEAKETAVDSATYTLGGGNSFISIMRETVGVGSSPASSGISLFHRVVVDDDVTLPGHLNSASWIFSTFENINFTDVDIGDLLYIDFTLRIAGEVEQVHRISRNTLRAIGFQNLTGYAPYLDADDDVINGAIVPCYMVMGNGGAGNLREDLINPTMGRVNSHRNSGRGQVHFFFVESNDKLASINVSTRQDNVVILTRMDIVLEQEAV